jgi:uncharacterized protein YecT (DUF1311 family)
MKKQFLIIPSVVILLLSCKQNLKKEGVRSSERNIDNTLFDCYDGSQLEMNVCSQKEFQYYDSILHAEYNHLISSLDSNIAITATYPDNFEYKEMLELKNTIISSQKAWSILRDKNSEVLRVKYEGGTMQPLVINNQMTTDTKNRIKYIRELNNEL